MQFLNVFLKVCCKPVIFNNDEDNDYEEFFFSMQALTDLTLYR